ncbi:MAG: glycosyltransferase family 4 protein [Brevinematales bacterium]|nr:glycosyltransferase family 4 protein [Brevinematales bacterium]
MKVLVVNWRDIFHPEAGGAEVHIHEILKRKPSSWEVDFVSATFPGCSPREETPWYRILRLPNNFLFNFSFFFWWLCVGKKRGYDLVIDDISKIPLATPLYIRRIPLIAIMHHIHGKSLYTLLPWPLATYVYLMERWLLGVYTTTPLFAVSPSTAQDLFSLYRYQKLSVVYNGIEREPLFFEEKMERRDNTPLVVYLGRLKSYKRVDHFLRMASLVSLRFPEAHFLVVGQGEEKEKLQKLARELSLEEKVGFTGFVDEKLKEDILVRAWLMVLPSEKEGWGIVVIEANALGTPVVAYRIPGLQDSIQHGVTGILVDTFSPEALAREVCALLEDTQRWKTLSQQALAWAKRFHWDEMARDFYDHLEHVVKEWHDGPSL